MAKVLKISDDKINMNGCEILAIHHIHMPYILDSNVKRWCFSFSFHIHEKNSKVQNKHFLEGEIDNFMPNKNMKNFSKTGHKYLTHNEICPDIPVRGWLCFFTVMFFYPSFFLNVIVRSISCNYGNKPMGRWRKTRITSAKKKKKNNKT